MVKFKTKHIFSFIKNMSMFISDPYVYIYITYINKYKKNQYKFSDENFEKRVLQKMRFL